MHNEESAVESIVKDPRNFERDRSLEDSKDFYYLILPNFHGKSISKMLNIASLHLGTAV